MASRHRLCEKSLSENDEKMIRSYTEKYVKAITENIRSRFPENVLSTLAALAIFNVEAFPADPNSNDFTVHGKGDIETIAKHYNDGVKSVQSE